MMTANNDNEAVLTVSELAARWKCTRRSVLLKIHAGEMHAFRIGGQCSTRFVAAR